MDVELYVYDLSKVRLLAGRHISQGLARQMSAGFLGVHIDAVYHTAIVFGGIEYFFGAGVQTTYPGATHHGRPMEIIPMGKTDLPLEVILEYLESLKEVYTAESYDLFIHNCNNFSNDFAMFLVGKNIPSHITSLPQTVLNTPFGQMLKPQLDQAMRGITQAPVASAPVPRSGAQSNRNLNGSSAASATRINGATAAAAEEQAVGKVHNVTQLRNLEALLDSAKTSCAVIFFTSATCPPCKMVYPAYDELAAEAGAKAVLIKVDISQAYEIGSRYQIRVTPTFITFLRGEKESEWSGANESQLRGNIRLLLQMAHPPHPHTKLRLPTLQRQHRHPVTYAKVPPLDKLIAKLGSSANDPDVISLKNFVAARHASGAADAPLPSLPTISRYIQNAVQSLPLESLFPLIDLLRLSLIDARVSGFFAEEEEEKRKPTPSSSPTTISTLISTALSPTSPYTLRIVTVQLACNLFTSPLLPRQTLKTSPSFSNILIQLITSSLLDTAHAPIRAAAASLAFNLAAANHAPRLEQEEDLLPESAQVELMAGLLEAVGREGEDGLKGLLLAVGLLAYGAPQGGELVDLCEALGAPGVVAAVRKDRGEEIRKLVAEVEKVV
ncbi:MAG: hypothetical protein Q9191_007734 [Dirinaria sp. TL-2023a]